MIYFIGAGPGAADLITVKGKELLEKALAWNSQCFVWHYRPIFRQIVPI